MAFLRGLLALPLIIGIVAFSITHTTSVPVILNPFEPPTELPLYIVALGFLAIGVLLGSIVAWINMGNTRKEKRIQRKKIKKLEKHIESLENKIDQENINFSERRSSKENITELASIEDNRKIL